MFEFVLFLHILSGVVLAAGNAAGLGATLTARRTSSAPTTLTLMRLHHWAILGLVIPSSAVVLATGLYLVSQMRLSFTTPWILWSIIVWIIAILLGLVLLVPAETRAIREAERLVDQNVVESSEALRGHVGAPAIVWGEWLQQALIVIFLYLMVYKPS